MRESKSSYFLQQNLGSLFFWDNPFFDLHFKKVYSLEAYSCASKYAFAQDCKQAESCIPQGLADREL